MSSARKGLTIVGQFVGKYFGGPFGAWIGAPIGGERWEALPPIELQRELKQVIPAHKGEGSA